MYRETPPSEYYTLGVANAPGLAQLEGIVWDDDTVSIRWLTEYRSFSNWNDLDTFLKVHGHPEYGTRIEWYTVQREDSKGG